VGVGEVQDYQWITFITEKNFFHYLLLFRNIIATFCHFFEDPSLLASFVEILFIRERRPSNMIADSRPALAQESIVSYAFPSNLPAVNCRLSWSV